jgi:hypothetical protein
MQGKRRPIARIHWVQIIISAVFPQRGNFKFPHDLRNIPAARKFRGKIIFPHHFLNICSVFPQ